MHIQGRIFPVTENRIEEKYFSRAIPEGEIEGAAVVLIVNSGIFYYHFETILDKSPI